MGKIKLFTLFYIIFSINSICYAQTIIEGYVTDVETSKGVFASVVLKDENGKIIIYTNTKNEGYFELKTTIKGVFNLNVSSLSYEAQSKKIEITSSTKIKKDFILKPKTTVLQEVVVQSRRPITVKKDTPIICISLFALNNSFNA